METRHYRCWLCGFEGRLEPSFPRMDAPCPNCNLLLYPEETRPEAGAKPQPPGRKQGPQQFDLLRPAGRSAVFIIYLFLGCFPLLAIVGILSEDPKYRATGPVWFWSLVILLAIAALGIASAVVALFSGFIVVEDDRILFPRIPVFLLGLFRRRVRFSDVERFGRGVHEGVYASMYFSLPVSALVLRFRVRTGGGRTRDYVLRLGNHPEREAIVRLISERLGLVPEALEESFWGAPRFPVK